MVIYQTVCGRENIKVHARCSRTPVVVRIDGAQATITKNQGVQK
jgi:hypothetical protein